MAKKSRPAETTLSKLHHDGNLSYKIGVLLHDLSSIGRDPNARKRLSSTTHGLYISGPYFMDCEAIKIWTTLVDNTTKTIITEEDSARSVNNHFFFFLIKRLHWRRLSLADWPISSKSVKLVVTQGRADRTTWSRSMQALWALKKRSWRINAS